MDEPKKINVVDETNININPTPTPEDITLADIEAINTVEVIPQAETETVIPAISTIDEVKDEPVATESAVLPYTSSAHGATAVHQPISTKAKRFILAYLTTIFSALSLLGSVSVLGFVLANHFLGPKEDEDLSLFYLDFAPFYISVMASIITFAVLYIVASRYVAKSAADDTIGLKDWRVYKVAYSVFAASLFAFGASVVGSLLYIPLAQLMIADDMSSKQIQVLVAGSLFVLLWIGLLVWQERLVKHGKASWLQGTVVVVVALVVVVLTAIYPVGSKTDDRYDHRISTDLSAIETKIDKFKSDNKDDIPATLSLLEFDDEPIKNRLAQYTYTVKEAEKPKTSASSTSDLMKRLSAQQTLGSSGAGLTSEMTEDYYDSLYGSSLSSSASAKKTYEICATFKTDTSIKKGSGSILDNLAAATSAASSAKGNSDAFTKHKSGKVCYTRD